jgi:hypothetical protein
LILLIPFAETAHRVTVERYTVRVVLEKVIEYARLAEFVHTDPPKQEDVTTDSQTPYADHVPHANQTNK